MASTIAARHGAAVGTVYARKRRVRSFGGRVQTSRMGGRKAHGLGSVVTGRAAAPVGAKALEDEAGSVDRPIDFERADKTGAIVCDRQTNVGSREMQSFHA